VASKFERTTTPGIYKRGNSYIVRQRDRQGRMHSRTAPTMAAAKHVLAELHADSRRGQLRAETQDAFDGYAVEWIRTYRGRTSRGFRESTREEYAGALNRHAIPFFGRMRISEITPRDIKQYAQWCSDKGLGRHGVKNALCPVKALLATAFEDGDIRVNPAANVRVVLQTTDPDQDRNKVRALTPDELERFVEAVPAHWRLLVTFLACTGLRIGEASELRWGDVDLTSSVLHVRRARFRGAVGPPKSRFGVRSVPLTDDLRKRLATHKLGSPFSQDDDVVFASAAGTPLDVHNVRARVIKRAAKLAGVPWVSFHSLRHTFASMCFRNGCNAKQVQLLLGHHAASFTLDTYIHAMPEDLPRLDFLGSVARLS
jgi:integrase